jgi:predicted nucleic acid-binding protein
MNVCDASVVVDVLCDTGSQALDARFEVVLESELHAPHLLDLEVASALRRRVRRGELALATAHAALRSLDTLRVRRYPHTALLERAWSLRDNASIYDASYIALAEALGASLLTTDARLARAARKLVEVELMA